MLLLPGPEHRDDYNEGLVVAGKPIRVLEKGMGDRNSTAFCVWDGSIVLIKYVECLVNSGSEGQGLHPNRVLEIGAGTGLAGLSLAALWPHASVYLTDVDEALEELQLNLELNEKVLGKDRVRIRPCDWTRCRDEAVLKEFSFDLVIATDCVWLADLVQPFVDTLEVIFQRNPKCICLMSHQHRTTKVDDMLFGLLRQKHIESCRVPLLPLEPDRRKIDIYELTSIVKDKESDV